MWRTPVMSVAGEMKGFLNAAAVVLMALTVIACGAIGTLKGSDDGWKRNTELWSDVPKMDGLSPSNLEPPFFVKLLMRTALNQIGGRGGKETGDWIVFDSEKTLDEIKNFYSNERMAAKGWDKSDKSTCVSGNEYGAAQVGLVCFFARHEGDKDIGLMIIPAKSEEAGKINVWFVRVETPRDSAQSPSSESKRANDERSTNMSTAPAPYGIDQRPMPAGTNINQLLPGRVGRYAREGLRSGTSENLKPDEIGGAIDAPIYADYRSGNDSIFVELGVMHSVRDARDSLDVAVGDAAGGVFPTDPRFGARGKEPSYLKVIDNNGAFFAWTRGSYFFSAHAKNGEVALDDFMRSFPY
jgi:hypothetical protein